MTTTTKIQKFGTAGYVYRGIGIVPRSGSRGRRYYEIDLTKFVTDQYRADFYSTVDTFKINTDTIANAVTTIDEMFDDGDLA